PAATWSTATPLRFRARSATAASCSSWTFEFENYARPGPPDDGSAGDDCCPWLPKSAAGTSGCDSRTRRLHGELRIMPQHQSESPRLIGAPYRGLTTRAGRGPRTAHFLSRRVSSQAPEPPDAADAVARFEDRRPHRFSGLRSCARQEVAGSHVTVAVR